MDETPVGESPGRRLRRRKAEEPGTAAMAARRIVATSYSCDRTNAALVHRLGNGWRRKRRSGPVSLATDSKFVYWSFHLAIRLVLYFVKFLHSANSYLYHIRPEKSAYFSKLCVVFLCQLLSFSIDCPFKIVCIYVSPTLTPNFLFFNATLSFILQLQCIFTNWYVLIWF